MRELWHCWKTEQHRPLIQELEADAGDVSKGRSLCRLLRISI